jgi:hypothetical protein
MLTLLMWLRIELGGGRKRGNKPLSSLRGEVSIDQLSN